MIFRNIFTKNKHSTSIPFKFYILIFQLFSVFLLSCNGNIHEPDSEIIIPENKTKINWDESTMVKIADGGYARIRELNNQQLIAVYSRGSNLYIKYSNDQGVSWENEEILFEGDDNYNMTNAEAIQLEDNSIIVGCNRRVKDAFWGGDYRYGIMIVRSEDYGKTWQQPQLLYLAGNTTRTGCWEPSFLQLPDGELHCYFANEYPYQNTNEQEISLFRSFDNGVSWTDEAETVCFAANARDGMPVPVLHNDSILLAIEDNSNGHLLQPSIIIESVKSNWKNGFVDAHDTRRFQAVPDFDDSRYAGAPYIAVLKSGKIIISYQDRAEREKDYEIMKVRISDGVKQPFHSETVPFEVNNNNYTKWNSLTVLRNNEILAVTSTNAFAKGVYMIKGNVIHTNDTTTAIDSDK